LKKTGWKVSTRFRGANWKGNGWGCRMMSGVMSDAGAGGNYYKSQKMAQDIILKQQRTGIYPCAGAARVPDLAHRSQRLALDLPHNPKSHLKSKTTAGRVNHHEASVSIMMVGLDSEGIRYNRDPEITVANVHDKLQRDGHTIPKAHIFNCVPLKDRKVDPKHFKTCKGRNSEIFKSVWQHKEGIRNIVNRFYDEYNKFNTTRAAGEEFHVVFYCESRMHESTATAYGLKAWMMNIHENIDVILCYKCGEHHGKRFCALSRCKWCSVWAGRKQWEMNLVEKALTDAWNI